MKKKYIVSSGCSYGITMSSIFDNPINRYSDEIKPFLDFKFDTIYEKFCDELCHIEVSLPSQSSEYISDSIIYTVNSLLKNGISNEDIYVFVEWTEYDRIAVHQEKYMNTEKIKWESIVKPNQWGFSKNIEIFSSEELNGLGKIGNLLYLNPTHTSDTLIKKLGTEEAYWKSVMVEYELNIPQLSKIKRYLDNILKTQTFLKLNNIAYNFGFMQSEFSSWVMDAETLSPYKKYKINIHKPYIRKQKDNINYICINKNYNPKPSITEDIEVVFPEIKVLFNQIDLENFWFYENEKYRRGGIDEWCIDTFDMFGYVDDNPIQASYGVYNFPDWGSHPNKILYSLLHNKMCFNNKFFKVKNEWEQYITEKFFEDVNSDTMTKHYLTYSKKYIEDNHLLNTIDTSVIKK
jgi:hypothetical protein